MVFGFSGDHVALAAPSDEQQNESDDERASQKYDSNRYDLMTYNDAGTFDVGGKVSNNTGEAIKNMTWATYREMTQLGLMIVYQMFSLDIIELTEDGVRSIVSAVAGGLIGQFGSFALAIFSLGLVIRSYIQQNWSAFWKLLTLALISLTLLASLQSDRLNYVSFTSNISKELENTVMNVNPSLTQDYTPEAFQYSAGISNLAGEEDAYSQAQLGDNNGDLGEQLDVTSVDDTAVALENKVFHALIYQPYLLLQYGTTDEEAILDEDPERITKWLDSNPQTEDGIEARQDIVTEEYEDYENQNIVASNSWQQASYVMVMAISTIVQSVVYFFLAMVRILLQFSLIMMMLLLPFATFLSLFPSFETILGKYIRTLFTIVIFKALTMFFILVSVSFISLGYDMTSTTDDLYYRIFIQLAFSTVIIFMYMKRQVIMNMLEGGSLSVDEMGGNGHSAPMNGARRVMNKASQKGKEMKQKREGQKEKQRSFKNDGGSKDIKTIESRDSDARTESGSASGQTEQAHGSTGTEGGGGTRAIPTQQAQPSKMRQTASKAVTHVRTVQNGEDTAGRGNIYQGNTGEREGDRIEYQQSQKQQDKPNTKIRSFSQRMKQRQMGEEQSSNQSEASTSFSNKQAPHNHESAPQQQATVHHIDGEGTNTSPRNKTASTKRNPSNKRKTEQINSSSTKKQTDNHSSQRVKNPSSSNGKGAKKQAPSANNNNEVSYSNNVSQRTTENSGSQNHASDKRKNVPKQDNLQVDQAQREQKREELENKKAKQESDRLQRKYQQINEAQQYEIKKSSKHRNGRMGQTSRLNQDNEDE